MQATEIAAELESQLFPVLEVHRFYLSGVLVCLSGLSPFSNITFQVPFKMCSLLDLISVLCSLFYVPQFTGLGTHYTDTLTRVWNSLALVSRCLTSLL